MIALGACAAPFVFRLTPSPEAGYAMGAAFARFDRIAIGAACVLLGAEVLRTWLSRRTRRTISGRLRRFAGILFAGCTAYMGLAVSPRINELHVAGARRGEGEAGATLESIHRRAELIGRAEVALGIVLIGLHVFTVRGRRDDEDDDNEAPAVRPPGPASDDEASDGAA
jgi:hypothetical protein